MFKKKPLKIKKYHDARKILKQHDHKILELHSLIVGSSVEKKDGQWQLNILIIRDNPSFRLFEQINIDGLPVKIKITGKFYAHIDRKDKHRPAPGGVSCGHPDISAGTLGCTVYKPGPGEVTNAYILSNNHVLANQNDALLGDPIIQPGSFDGGDPATDQIATLSDYSELNFAGGTNYIDAALALADNYDDLSVGIEGVTNWVGEITEGLPGQAIIKSGRTTGTTEGFITEISGEVLICYETYKEVYCIKWAVFDEQIVTSNMGAGGDSGSLVIEATSGKAVGLYFAGSELFGLANPIGLIVERFGISFFPQRVQANITANYDIQDTEKELKANYNIDHWEKELKARYNIKGTTTSTDPYFIHNIYELQHTIDQINTRCYYELACDIDASETVNWHVEDSEIYGDPPYARGFLPIEGANYERMSIDGKCYEIADLFINRPTEGQIGLFGGLTTEGSKYFRNIVLKDVDITGLSAVGGLIGSIGKQSGKNDNKIEDCSVFGVVKSVTIGTAFTGGLCGQTSGSVVRRCSSSGIVSGLGSKVGGLLGQGEAVYDSYSNMEVYAFSDAAGFIPDPISIVQHCYSTGMVYGDELSGFLGGSPDIVNHCYWDVETSGQTESSGGGEPKTTAEMRQQSTFVEWDFINTWYIFENVSNPFLRQYCWLIDFDFEAEATCDFEAVKLTDSFDENSEAVFEQEFVSLTDELIENSEAADTWRNQVIIHPVFAENAESTCDHEITVEAGRLAHYDSKTTDDFDAINWSKFLEQHKYFSWQYTCEITGHQDGLDNIVLPISSFQSRLRLNAQNYTSVVVPVNDASVSMINLRPNGEIVISMQHVFRDEIIYSQEIIRTAIDDIRIDKGAINHTVVLTGYSQYDYISQTITLDDPMTFRVVSGKRTYRCKPNEFVRPGDIVTINNETFNIDLITWAVDATSEWMEIRES